MLESDVDYYFIDVRTLDEYYTESIPGFDINFDFYLFENNHSLLSKLDTSRPVVIMCNSGNRSVEASKIFLEIGFTEVYNLKNGIQGWDGETNNKRVINLTLFFR
jgi:rhodanese-related sulfurtransferase